MGLMRNILGYKLALPALSEPASPYTRRRKRLTDIIRHANAHCPYYKDKYTTFLNGEKDFTDEEFNYAFSHLPIINKSQIEQHNTEFQSCYIADQQELLKDEAPLSFWSLLNYIIFKKDFKASVSLSGTSANRWLDRHDAQIYAGSVLHALTKGGWRRGHNFVAFMPENSYFTQNLAEHNSFLYHFFGLSMCPFKSIDKNSVRKLLSILKTTKATTLMAFPHALLRIAQIMQEENIPPYESLRYINVSGSFFLDCNKNYIHTMFPNSDIQCSYGTTETGMIAHQISSLNSFDYEVFNEYIYLEQGPANSILATAYNQKAFPLIRYKIEDMGRVINCSDGKQKIKSLEGQNTDYLIGADGYMYFASFFNIFINELNKALTDPVIDFALTHNDQSNNGNGSYLHLRFVLSDQTKKEKIRKSVLETLGSVFANYDNIAVSFPHCIEHDFVTKYKLIRHNGSQVRFLGGYEAFKKAQPKPAAEQNTDKSVKEMDNHSDKKAS